MLEDLGPEDPAEIGSYRLRGRLGTGGMGTVYLGFTRAGEPVAVKVPHRDLAQDPEFRRRFAAEVAAARRVSGPGVAAVVSADVDTDLPWLASEYVPGTALDEAVRDGSLPSDAVHLLARGLAEALTAIHSVGVVHRDLKPSNVLLTATGPRVVDFGIATAGDTRFTRTGALIGSPGWIAPERLQGLEATAAADVWAWGACVAYAALGKSPFAADTAEAQVNRILTGQPNLAGVPEDLSGVVALALALAPTERPSAHTLAMQLGRYQSAHAKSRETMKLNVSASEASGTRRGTRTGTAKKSKPSRRRSFLLLWLAATAVAVAALIGSILLLNDAGLDWTPTGPRGPTTSHEAVPTIRNETPTPSLTSSTPRAAVTPTPSLTSSTPSATAIYDRLRRTPFRSEAFGGEALAPEPWKGPDKYYVGSLTMDVETEEDESAIVQFDIATQLDEGDLSRWRREEVAHGFAVVDVDEIAPGAYCFIDRRVEKEAGCVAGVGMVYIQTTVSTWDANGKPEPGSLDHAMQLLQDGVAHVEYLQR